MDTQELIFHIYTAFNKRDIDGALAPMSADVSWPQASEGDPVVNVLEVLDRNSGVTDVKVHQLVKDLKGNVLSDTELWHCYSFTNGLIDRMEIKEGEQTSF